VQRSKNFAENEHLGDYIYVAGSLVKRRKLGFEENASLLGFGVSQYLTDASSSDFIERAYVFGSTGFELADTMTFTVSSGTYTVNNLEVRARDDNFDFQSSNPIATTASAFLNDAFDPYGLIPTKGSESSETVPVDIVYVVPMTLLMLFMKGITAS